MPAAGDDEATSTGTVHDILYLGSDCRVRAGLDDGSHLIASVASHAATGWRPAAAVRLTFPQRPRSW